MYLPTAFQEADQGKLHDFIEAHSFALVVSTLSGELVASHFPLLLDRGAGPHGRLMGHLARANPQWHELEGQQVLAVFSGPHAYVSPTWYEAENVVPTWNYVAVHAYGICRLVEDPKAVEQILSRTVATYERGMANPWSIDPATGFFERMAKAVVGLEIAIARLEGKWKLSQNHPQERQEKVVRALAESAQPDAREIARLMADRLRGAGTKGPRDHPGD
jgi:transcriptional regulator